MKKLYIFREFCKYHVGFFDDIVCVASNIDEASELIYDKLTLKHINKEEGIDEIKKYVGVFDLNTGIKEL
jgi:hypothetical protein